MIEIYTSFLNQQLEVTRLQLIATRTIYHLTMSGCVGRIHGKGVVWEVERRETYLLVSQDHMVQCSLGVVDSIHRSPLKDEERGQYTELRLRFKLGEKKYYGPCGPQVWVV